MPLALLYCHACWVRGRTSWRKKNKTAARSVYHIYIFYSYFQPLLHMNRKATFIFSLWGKSHRQKSPPYAQRRWDSFVVTVCVCVCGCVCVCRYTQRILTVDLSHVEIWLEVSLEIKTLTKKKLKQQNNKKTQQKKNTTDSRIQFDPHFTRTHRQRNICRVFDQLLFFFFSSVCVCDSYAVLTSAVSWCHLAVWVALTH